MSILSCFVTNHFHWTLGDTLFLYYETSIDERVPKHRTYGNNNMERNRLCGAEIHGKSECGFRANDTRMYLKRFVGRSDIFDRLQCDESHIILLL